MCGRSRVDRVASVASDFSAEDCRDTSLMITRWISKRNRLHSLLTMMFGVFLFCHSAHAHRGPTYKHPQNVTDQVRVTLAFPDAPYFIDEWYPISFKVTNNSRRPLHIYSDMPFILEFNGTTNEIMYVRSEYWDYPWENKLLSVPPALVTTIEPSKEKTFDFRQGIYSNIDGLRLGATNLISARVRFMVSSNECAASNWAPIRFSNRKMTDEPVILYGQTTQGTDLPYSAFRICTLEGRRFLYHQRIRAFEIPADAEPRFDRDVKNSMLKVFTRKSDTKPIIWNSRMMRIEDEMRSDRNEQPTAQAQSEDAPSY